MTPVGHIPLQTDPFYAACVESILARPLTPDSPGWSSAARTVADLGHDPAFIRRIADREFVSAFRARFRAIVPADPALREVPPPPAEMPLTGECVSALAAAFAFPVFIREVTPLASAISPSAAPPALADAPAISSDSIHALRLQLSRGDHFEGPGSGDNIDLAVSLLNELPDVHANIHLRASHVVPFLRTLQERALPRRAPIALHPVTDASASTNPHANLSQWAHDNAKAARHESGSPAYLVPSFATRSDCPSERIESERFAATTICHTDPAGAEPIPVHTLPLLFQGGNILLVEDPARRIPHPERVLVIGEAELERNRPSGQSTAEIAESFRIHFSADRLLVLPNVSFHIDYDFAFRIVDGRVVAMVNDPVTACRIVAGIAIDNLDRARAVPSALIHELRLAVASLDATRIAAAFGAAMRPHVTSEGFFAPSILPIFAPTHAAAGETPNQPAPRIGARIATVHRTLAAFDHLIAPLFAHPGAPSSSPTESFFRALARQHREREHLHDLLRRQGWKVIAIPSTSDAECSMNALNALQTSTRVLIPSLGGTLSPLDAAARSAWNLAVGSSNSGGSDRSGVTVTPIPSDESQRRQGAIRCSASII